MHGCLEIMYERLAAFLLENIAFDNVSVILEAGCGSGQLTIPFVKRVSKIKKDFKVIAFDISAGPYEGDLNILKERIQKEGLENFVFTVKGDARNMEEIADESVDLIISNELFCDLDKKGLERTLQEFYRILKKNGKMAHGELSPTPENEAQRLLIKADAFSIETLQPKPKWFSPFSDEVVALMHKIGFRNITVKYFETNVKMNYKEALKYLKGWVSQNFLKTRQKQLKKYGIEFPIEHVIFCEK
ncbi:MAG: methyltransferase domain-containing protein [Candidatus Bathyarchaeia archaeon]